jgi:hypothetical protein
MSDPIFYVPDESAEEWQVATGKEFITDVCVTLEQLPRFHRFMADKYGEAWKYMRLLYAVNPVVMPVTCDAAYLRADWTLSELAMFLGVKKVIINDRIQVALLAWRREMPDALQPPPAQNRGGRPRKNAAEIGPKKNPSAPAQPKGQRGRPKKNIAPSVFQDRNDPPPSLAPCFSAEPTPETVARPSATVAHTEPSTAPEDRQGDILFKYGFSWQMFKNGDEAAWFKHRLGELERLFNEPAVSALAREIIFNEMYLRRINEDLARVSSTDDAFSDLNENRGKLSSELREAWEQICERVPWASEVGSRMNVIGIMSDAIQSCRDYESKGCSKRLDGFYTNLEIQVQMRDAVQRPSQYRFGQVVYLREAMDNIFDPLWKRKLPLKVYKALDMGVKEAVKKLVEDGQYDSLDMESEGAAGEFPPLFVPTDDSADDNPNPTDAPAGEQPTEHIDSGSPASEVPTQPGPNL